MTLSGSSFILGVMDDKTTHAVLTHLTAQTELLSVIARYYASLDERELVRAISGRTLHELREAHPEAAALAERVGARGGPNPKFAAEAA